LTSANPEETRRKLSETSKGRTPWNKGKKHTEITKKKISILTKIALSHPTTKQKMRLSQLGRKHTDETKKKISSANLGKKLSNETRKKLSESLKMTHENNPILRKQISERNKGRKATDETKRKMSIARKGKTTRFDYKHSEETKMKISKKTSGRNNPNYGKVHSDVALEKIRRARDRQVFPRKDSKPELLVQSILVKNNIDFTKHFSFKLTRSRHQADLMIEPHKIIEVFGDYWHFNPKHYDGESVQKKSGKNVKVKDVWKYDKYVIDGMRTQGYKVLVVWESELKDELEDIAKKILKFAKS
jgi:G:T-mismatch repair DNA endonuclease (very short patch repair protein)